MYCFQSLAKLQNALLYWLQIPRGKYCSLKGKDNEYQIPDNFHMSHALFRKISKFNINAAEKKMNNNYVVVKLFFILKRDLLSVSLQ